MEAVHGNVADIKKIRSRAVVSIHVEIPVESYAAAVAMLDEKDVLITIAPKDVGPYGLIVSEDKPDIGITMSEEKPAKIDHKNSRLAAMYCKNENFRDFLADTMLFCVRGEVLESEARQEIVRACCIKSRSELDTNMVAQEKFIQFICKPYTAYMQSREGK